jgi:hypothetical protein
MAKNGDQCLVSLIDNTLHRQAEQTLMNERVKELAMANTELAYQNDENGKLSEYEGTGILPTCTDLS